MKFLISFVCLSLLSIGSFALAAPKEGQKNRNPASAEECKDVALKAVQAIDELSGETARQLKVTSSSGRSSFTYNVSASGGTGRNFAPAQYVVRIGQEPEFGVCIIRSVSEVGN